MRRHLAIEELIIPCAVAFAGLCLAIPLAASAQDAAPASEAAPPAPSVPPAAVAAPPAPAPPSGYAYPPGYPYPPPGYGYPPAGNEPPPSPPPPDPRTQPGYHLHDGFYFRFGLGLGAMVGSATVTSTDFSVSALALSDELSVGWAPIPGLAIGIGEYLAFSVVQTVSGGGVNNAAAGQLISGLVGVFVDFYPYPTKGFHVEGAVGLGALSWSTGRDTSSGAYNYYRIPAYDYSGGPGFGFMLGAGYEWWISPNWSLGALFRVIGVSATLKADRSEPQTTPPNMHMTMWAPGILANVTYQ